MALSTQRKDAPPNQSTASSDTASKPGRGVAGEADHGAGAVPFNAPRWVWAGLLVAATLLAYLPALNGKFLWDDDAWTLTIPHLLRDFSGLRLLWTQVTALQQYYPLTGTTFWIDYHLWGFWSLPYHFENVLLHSLAALLFWRLLRRLEVPGAWLAAALFALHPLMVESAAWIAERKNVLSLSLYLLALLAYGQFNGFWNADNQSNASPLRGRAYFAALLLFLAALLAKTTAFSLPAVLLLLVWWRRGRIGWRQDVLPSLPFFALALGLGLVTSWLEKNHTGVGGSDWAISFPARCLIAGQALWFYAGKLLWPAGLCFIYPRWELDTHSLVQWLYPIAAAGALLALWLARARLGRGAATAALFFVGTILPLLGFVNGYFMRYSFVCDHWSYLPSLGLIAMAAALVARASTGLRQPALPYGFAALVLPVLLVLTWRQSSMYRDMETLWTTTLARNPQATMAHNNLGSLLLEQGRVEEAIQHFRKALELKPGAADVQSNLGGALLQQGQVSEAIIQLKQAVALQPDSAQAHNNLGNALLQQGQIQEALTHLQRAAELAPSLAGAHFNLGSALIQAGRPQEAIPQLEQALQLQPGLAEAESNLGNALVQTGRTEEGIAHLRKAVELAPGLAVAQHGLGFALFQAGQLDEAAARFQRALAIQPGLAASHNGLGNVLLRKGQVEPAIAEFKIALQLQPAFAEAQLNLAGALTQLGRLDEAIAHFEAALELEPELAAAHNNLANALLRQGKVDAAISHLETAIKLRPDLAEAHNNLGNAYFQKGRAREAVTQYQAAIVAQPANPYLLNNLAWVLATYPEPGVRNGAKAVELAQEADRLTAGKEAGIVGTLAAAYAEGGRFPEAVAATQRALELTGTNAAQANPQRARLALYRTGSPFRDQDLLPRK